MSALGYRGRDVNCFGAYNILAQNLFDNTEEETSFISESRQTNVYKLSLPIQES